MKYVPHLTCLVACLIMTQVALGGDCAVAIDSNDAMQYSKDQITVDRACGEIKLTLTHSGNMQREAMGHNWVLTTGADAEAAYQDGMQAGLDNEFVKPDDDRVIAHTKVIGGGEETTISFSFDNLDPDGEYTFFCSFPGHFAVMRGEFRIVEGG